MTFNEDKRYELCSPREADQNYHKKTLCKRTLCESRVLAIRFFCSGLFAFFKSLLIPSLECAHQESRIKLQEALCRWAFEADQLIVHTTIADLLLNNSFVSPIYNNSMSRIKLVIFIPKKQRRIFFHFYFLFRILSSIILDIKNMLLYRDINNRNKCRQSCKSGKVEQILPTCNKEWNSEVIQNERNSSVWIQTNRWQQKIEIVDEQFVFWSYVCTFIFSFESLPICFIYKHLIENMY